MPKLPTPTRGADRRQVLLAALMSGLWPLGASSQGVVPALMRAREHHRGIDVAAHWVSEKLDGVRARWQGGRLYTRSGLLISPPEGFTHAWPAVELDGELWAGRGQFERASATVRKHAANPADWQALRFMVFDLPEHPGAFGERWQALQSWAATSTSSTWALVVQERLRDETELQARLAQVVAEGGEGLMLHHGAGHYRSGPSPHLLKLKPQADAEALVLGHEPGQGAFTGMVGALRVQTPEGLVFRLGSGLTLAERQTPPAIGSWVTYRYRGHHASGVPRFATFWRVRPSE
jgi:DNA ligase-1